MTKKKVCIIAPIHKYSDVRIFHKEAKTIFEDGYEVILFAQHTNNDIIEGITVKAIPEFGGFLKRMFVQPWIFLQVIRCEADIVHLHNPDTLILGFIFKSLRKKVIYDTHEDFTKKILVREWLPKVLRLPIAKCVGRLEFMAGKFFDKVITTQPDVCQRIGTNCIVIENPPKINKKIIDKVYSRASSIEKGNCFRTIYLGTINEIRGLFEMLTAMAYLNEEYGLSARFWLIGPIKQELLEQAQKHPGWHYTDF